MDPQNTNARFLDKFNSHKTTSVRIRQPPGKFLLNKVDSHLSQLDGKNPKGPLLGQTI